MDGIEISILNKRQRLKDTLNIAVRQNPAILSIVKLLKEDIKFCDFILNNINIEKSKYKII